MVMKMHVRCKITVAEGNQGKYTGKITLEVVKPNLKKVFGFTRTTEMSGSRAIITDRFEKDGKPFATVKYQVIDGQTTLLTAKKLFSQAALMLFEIATQPMGEALKDFLLKQAGLQQIGKHSLTPSRYEENAWVVVIDEDDNEDRIRCDAVIELCT